MGRPWPGKERRKRGADWVKRWRAITFPREVAFPDLTRKTAPPSGQRNGSKPPKPPETDSNEHFQEARNPGGRRGRDRVRPSRIADRGRADRRRRRPGHQDQRRLQLPADQGQGLLSPSPRKPKKGRARKRPPLFESKGVVQ